MDERSRRSWSELRLISLCFCTLTLDPVQPVIADVEEAEKVNKMDADVKVSGGTVQGAVLPLMFGHGAEETMATQPLTSGRVPELAQELTPELAEDLVCESPFEQAQDLDTDNTSESAQEADKLELVGVDDSLHMPDNEGG